jgi:hypothetical protein
MAIPDNQKICFEIQLVAHMTAAGGRQVPVRNVFHYARSLPLAPLPLYTDIISAFDTAVGTPLFAALNARYAAEFYLCRCLDDPTDQFVEVISAAVGAIGTDSYDSRSAVYMQLVSRFRGRSYNGSKHFAPLSEVDTTGDILTGAGLTRWEAVRDALKLTFTATGQVFRPVIFSRLLSDVTLMPRASLVYSDVVNVLLNKNVGDMRKRKSGRVVA